MNRFWRCTLAAAALLVLPLAALLFAQWPLREVVQAGSRLANDMAQVLFALYSAVAVTAATQAGTHLAAHTDSATRDSAWRHWALFACVAPWSAFLLYSSAPTVWRSVVETERFAEAQTPGYFIVKLALWLLAALVLLNSLADAARLMRRNKP